VCSDHQVGVVVGIFKPACCSGSVVSMLPLRVRYLGGKMSKRSLSWALALAVVAGLAFATPSHAGSFLVTTDIQFTVVSGGPATDITASYTPAVDPISNLQLTPGMTGGLSGLGISESSSNTIEVTFTGANATNGTNLQWTYVTSQPSSLMISAGLSPAGVKWTLSASVSETPLGVPEPSTFAILGIGMTGLLAFRRFFKKTS